MLKAQGASKPFSRPCAPTFTELMVPLLPVIAISYQAEGVAIWLCQTQFLGNSEAVLPMLYSVTGSTWRQSLNTAVVQEAMS